MSRSTTVNGPALTACRRQNSKWDSGHKDTTTLSNARPDRRDQQRIQSASSQVVHAGERKFIDLIKYFIVSFALACVMIGGGYVAYYGDRENVVSTPELSIQQYEEISYFGGMLTVVRMKKAVGEGADLGKVLVEMPHFVETLLTKLQHLLDLFAWYLSAFDDDFSMENDTSTGAI